MTNHEPGKDANVKPPLEQASDALEEAFPLTDDERNELDQVITGGWDNWNNQYSDDDKADMRAEAAKALGVDPSNLDDEQVVRWHSTQFFLEEDILPRLEKKDPAVRNLPLDQQLTRWLVHSSMEQDQDSK